MNLKNVIIMDSLRQLMTFPDRGTEVNECVSSC